LCFVDSLTANRLRASPASPGTAARAADRATTPGGKFGNEFIGFFFVAVGAGRVFGLRIHGLQKDEILAAGIAHIFVIWHKNTPLKK